MFNIKYNLLVIFQIVLGLVNSILLIKTFGVSAKVDAYLLSSSMMIALQLILMMPLEQFLQFYNDAKLESQENANKFFNCSYLYALILGLVAYFCLFLLINLVIKMFAFEIDPERFLLVKSIFSLHIITSLFMPLIYLNEKLLNAEMRFSIPYILSSFSILFIVIAQLIIIFLNNENILLLAYAQVLGTSVSVLTGSIIIFKQQIPFQLTFYHPLMKKFIKNSISMRFGHNIHNFLVPLITNNLLTIFPAGSITYFYYAKKIIDIVNNISIGPPTRILLSKMSEYFVEKKINEIKQIMTDFIKKSFILFTSIVVGTYFAIPYILKFIAPGKLNDIDIQNISTIFLFLSVWYLLILLEIPYTFLNVTAKDSVLFICGNTIFIITFIVFCLFFKNYFAILVIPIGSIFSQIINFMIYYKFANDKMKALSMQEALV